jgi:hypothetical protein
MTSLKSPAGADVNGKPRRYDVIQQASPVWRFTVCHAGTTLCPAQALISHVMPAKAGIQVFFHVIPAQAGIQVFAHIIPTTTGIAQDCSRNALLYKTKKIKNPATGKPGGVGLSGQGD